MYLRRLIGVGDRILAATLPVSAVGIAANLTWPSVFGTGLGTAGRVAAIVLLASGVALYLMALTQVLSCCLLLESWLGSVLGATMYVASRHFRGLEEAQLAATFGDAYRTYGARVLLSWL